MHLLRWVVIVWLTLLISIFIAILYGQTKVDRLLSFGLDICEGKPCFMGIMPGVTRWNDVRSHLKGYDIWLEDKDRIAMMFTNTIGADIYRYPVTQPTVTLVNVSDSTIIELTPTIFPPVGDFILKYGEPCWVLLDTYSQSPNGYVTRLVYPTMTLDLDINKPFIPSARVGLVQIMKDDMTNEPHDLCANEQTMYEGLVWAGFASPYRYIDALLKKQKLR